MTDGQDSGRDTQGDSGLAGCEGMDTAFAEIVAAMESEFAAYGVPGGALAIVCDNQLAYTHSVGLAHHEGSEAITPHTRFQLASTTKMFTAATAVQMADEGLVSLTEPVDTYVSYTNVQDPFEEPVTLHQLLSHTAGYPTYFPGGGFHPDLDAYFRLNDEQPLWSTPGAVYNYSNLGMALAGLALQEASGTPFADLVEDRIFSPAGMGTASMHAAVVEAEGEWATGHSGSASSPNLTSPTDSYYATGYYGPMGGAWGSVTDLARWGLVHLEGGADVLSETALTSLQTPVSPTRRFPEQGYGYGHFIDRIFGFDLLSHSGSVGGFLTTWMLVPERGFGVFVVVNCDWYYPGSLAYDALGSFVGLDFDLGPYASSSEDWPSFVGSYEDPVSFGTVEVLIEEGSLVARFVDLGFESTLVGYYEDAYTFQYAPSGSTQMLAFWRDEDGEAEWLVSLYGVARRAVSRPKTQLK